MVDFDRQGSAGRTGAPPHNGCARPVFAAVDLGTNNCRLLVARPTGDSFQVVDSFSRIVRLGEKLAVTGELAMDAMDRTVDALQVCASKLRRRGVTGFRGVATEACRRARNGGAFVARIASETGLSLEIIEAEEEAALALAGCAALLDGEAPYALLFDIGGGSTEVTWLARENGTWRLIDSLSLGTGVVVLAERLGHDRVTPQEYESLVEDTAASLMAFDQRHGIRAYVDAEQVQMLGASGTVTTLSGMNLDLPRYIRARVDGSWLDRPRIRAICAQLCDMDWRGRAAQACIGAERADLVLAGCAILEGILRVWPASRLRVADRGLREGILLGLMRGTPEYRSRAPS